MTLLADLNLFTVLLSQSYPSSGCNMNLFLTFKETVIKTSIEIIYN